MKRFGIWRPENAIGNSAEQIIGLAKHLKKENISEFKVLVEKEFQRDFALCIPGVSAANVEYFPSPEDTGVSVKDLVKHHPDHKDIYMPGPNEDFLNVYPSTWPALKEGLDVTLSFNEEEYENKFNLPKDAIVVFYREAGTWRGKRDESPWLEPERFVQPSVYFEVCFDLVRRGYKVVRIGDSHQTPFPRKYTRTSYGAKVEVENLIDFTKYVNVKGEPLWSFQDYLFLLQNCKLFISADAGIWPMAAAMKKNMVFSDVVYRKYTEWLPLETTQILFKKFKDKNNQEVTPPFCVNTVNYAEFLQISVHDNTTKDILDIANRFLG
jgi:putative glycosyltransferase (TIGR04372 family)